MRRFTLFILGISLGVIVTLALLWRGLASEVQAQSGDATPQAGGVTSDEGIVQFHIEPASGDETMPAALSAGPQSPDVLPTPVPGDTLLYFVPTDNDATATVLYLYNTDTEEEVTYQIVGDDEADLKEGKISVSSPISRALIGKHVGDEAVVQAPNGDICYEIVDVRYQ